MPRIGPVLASLGALGFLTGLALFGWLFVDLFRVHDAHHGSATVGEDYVSPLFDVDDSDLYRLAVRMRIESEETRDRRRQMFEDERHELAYAFPIRYTIVDARGTTLHEAVDLIDGLGEVLSGRRHHIGSTGGVTHWKHGLAKFALPSGTTSIGIRVRIDPDTTYGATASNVEIFLQDRLRPIAFRLITAIVATVLGLGLLITGIVIFALRNDPIVVASTDD